MHNIDCANEVENWLDHLLTVPAKRESPIPWRQILWQLNLVNDGEHHLQTTDLVVSEAFALRTPPHKSPGTKMFFKQSARAYSGERRWELCAMCLRPDSFRESSSATFLGRSTL